MVNKQLRCLRKVDIINSRILGKKTTVHDLCGFRKYSSFWWWKINLNESFTNKYKKDVACSYGYKLVCVDDKFSKPFNSYWGEDAVWFLLAAWSKKLNIVVLWW